VGELAGAIALQLRTGLLPVSDGAVSHIDVRDLAAVHVAVMEPGRGARRFMCGGHHLTMSRLAGLYRQLTGRPFPVLPLPAAGLRGLGRAMDAVLRFTPADSLFTAEAMTLLTRWVETDDRAISDELGVVLRPPAETLADAIRSLLADGRITSRQAGRLAAPS
jgi:dihydroflavonol-4-reductase